MARQVRRKRERKLSTAAWFGIGCGGAFALGIIVVLIVLGMAKATPPPPPEAAVSNGAAPATSAPPLEQQISSVEQTVRSQGTAQVSLTVRQDELNALIAHNPPPDVRNLRVYFGSGTIAATGETTWRGQNIPLTVRATPVVSGGELQVQVLEVRVGRLGAPAALHERVQQELQRGVRELTGGNRIRVESVSVSPGVMTLRGWVGGR